VSFKENQFETKRLVFIEYQQITNQQCQMSSKGRGGAGGGREVAENPPQCLSESRKGAYPTLLSAYACFINFLARSYFTVNYCQCYIKKKNDIFQGYLSLKMDQLFQLLLALIKAKPARVMALDCESKVSPLNSPTRNCGYFHIPCFTLSSINSALLFYNMEICLDQQ
jgi:hypothetical protein